MLSAHGNKELVFCEGEKGVLSEKVHLRMEFVRSLLFGLIYCFGISGTLKTQAFRKLAFFFEHKEQNKQNNLTKIRIHIITPFIFGIFICAVFLES